MSITSQALGVSERPWVLTLWPALILCLLVFLYATVLRGLAVQWARDPDYSYGFFVPVFSGYILWRLRGKLSGTETRPSNFGFLVMIGAICFLFLGSLGA